LLSPVFGGFWTVRHPLEAAPEGLDQGDGGDRSADHSEHRRAPDLIPRRQPRELAFDQVEIVGDSVSAFIVPGWRGFGRAEEQLVFVHPLGMAEDCSRTVAEPACAHYARGLVRLL